MPLKEYLHKRNFNRTPEPAQSKEKKITEESIYVIQQHHASHLHYDLRLEEKGVLKSWAIPKLPPAQEGVKRLAVRTEDHPLGYEDFEGVIPEGQYGAGRVKIWDKGTYRLLEADSTKRIIDISGQKLKGKYALIKLKPKENNDKNWLFFKVKTSPEEIKK